LGNVELSSIQMKVDEPGQQRDEVKADNPHKRSRKSVARLLLDSLGSLVYCGLFSKHRKDEGSRGKIYEEAYVLNESRALQRLLSDKNRDMRCRHGAELVKRTTEYSRWTTSCASWKECKGMKQCKCVLTSRLESYAIDVAQWQNLGRVFGTNSLIEDWMENCSEDIADILETWAASPY